ncbi:MAG: hypothetical protein HKP24_03035 [Croceitalea sp.]|nr:hypothetical protein [Croceitalea sp.]
MIKTYREAFNAQFSDEKYNKLLEELNTRFEQKVGFRVAESPVFIPKALKQHLVNATDDIMKVINHPNFKEQTQGAFLSEDIMVPNEDDHPKFIQLDFGICLDEHGEAVPKLIELQGFPSLYFYQELLARLYRKYYEIPEGFSIHPNGIDHKEFITLLREEIVGDTEPKQVILLEVEPEKQATNIDFYATSAMLGIKILCISKLKLRGKQLYYLDEQGNEIQVLKIYNRVIFDELYQRKDLYREFHFTEEVDVEWIGHPNWFFRISKYIMPMLKGDYVPKSYHLEKLDKLPANLENFVLKPLYSFAGAGVQLNVTKEMIENIPNKWNYLLQEKVKYHPIIETPDGPAKCEVRIMLLHNKKTQSIQIISNLVRLSKGEMIGVKYNKDKTWVGGGTGFFEL